MFHLPIQPRMKFALDVLIGTLTCAVVATFMVLIFRGSAMRPIVPLLFIAVIVLASIRFGLLAACAGAFCATLLFSYFLFTPVGSFKVQKGTARTNLAWMLLVGVPAGYFAWATKLDAGAKR